MTRKKKPAIDLDKDIDKGLRLMIKNQSFDMTFDDVKKLFDKAEVIPNRWNYDLLCKAFYLGVNQGYEIAKNEVKKNE